MALALCLTLLPATAQAADNTHEHCLCGAEHKSDIKTHQEGDKTNFEKWLKSDSAGSEYGLWIDDGTTEGKMLEKDSISNCLKLPAGTYYLLEGAEHSDVLRISHPIVIEEEVTICLNG